MKKLKKIKLTNIKNSELENEQLIRLKGGYETCGSKCTDAGCAGVKNYYKVAQTYKS
ncbi:TIGR04149 family rSAM-modified RiPP [Draconibacterium orientale]|uniref:TIGR04149 family rSAM-modified RiPP n=1 Tax=Draconibacterium orientale TaxID=1168034 RepID=UPI0029C0E2BD|nr:TIGR04149 family rSAM-modified RiPP [Draconibacterium orientale]